MKGWIVYDKSAASQNESDIQWFIDEATEQKIRLDLVLRENLDIGIVDGNYHLLHHGEKVCLPDFAIIRTVEPILQTYFDACNVLTFNSAQTSYLCNHKTLTHMEVNKLNIPMVSTYFISQATAPDNPPLPYPFIIKEANGRSGKQVHFVHNHKEWKQIIATVTTNDLLVQAANVKLGKDVRVFVIGNEIIDAVLRVNKHDFRANYSLGGSAYPYVLSANERSMIQKIIDHFDFDLVGIDFLISKQDQLLFNELEDVVGSRILSKVSKINLLEKYIIHIK